MNLSMLVAEVAIGFASLPLALGRVPPNPYYGFRTAATTSDPEAWYRANRICGWIMVGASIAGLALLATGVLPTLPAFALPFVIAAAAIFAFARPVKRTG